jgi:hypothetical protein
MWNTPAAVHSWKRRCTAELLPNCRGSAFHWQPVFSRYTMPAIARRSSNRERPPRACHRASGNQGSTYFQTSSGTSSNLDSIPGIDHAALRLATFRQVRGSALRREPIGRFRRKVSGTRRTELRHFAVMKATKPATDSRAGAASATPRTPGTPRVAWRKVGTLSICDDAQISDSSRLSMTQ